MGYVGKKPTPVPLTSSDVTDGIISNAKLAQDVISAETALAVAPADTDELLISDAGTLKRIDYSLIKSDPTHVLLSTTNISSGSADVTISSNIDSTYKVYMFEFFNIHPSSDGVKFQAQFLQGGSVDTGSVYDFTFADIRSSSSSVSVNQSESSTSIQLSRDVDNASSGSLNGRMFMYDPSSTTYETNIMFDTTGMRNANVFQTHRGGGCIQETAAVDGVKFFMSAGNIDDGTIKLYGVN